MTEEESSISKHIKLLTSHANNYEYIFIDAVNNEKKIPNSFLENYLEIIYEIDKQKIKLKQIKNETLFKT